MQKLEEKAKKSVDIKNLAARILPAVVGIGGFVGWGICAQKGYAASGLAIFGVTTFCSLGLAQLLGNHEVDYNPLQEQTNYNKKEKEDYID
jgi:hypothetical protein